MFLRIAFRYLEKRFLLVPNAVCVDKCGGESVSSLSQMQMQLYMIQKTSFVKNELARCELDVVNF